MALWSVVVPLPDLVVRHAVLRPRYGLTLLASLALWAAVLVVLGRLRAAARPLAFGLAMLFSAAVTLAVAGAQGYYLFFRTDLMSLEWEFALENPSWALVLARDATSGGQRALLVLVPTLLTAALLWLAGGFMAPGRRLRVAGGLALVLALSGGVTLYGKPLSADLLGLRAIVMGTRAHLLQGAHPRTLPAPQRIVLAERGPASRFDVLVILNESVGRREALGVGAQWPRSQAFLARHQGRAALFQRASASAGFTTVSLPSLLTGLEPGSSRDAYARAPLLWHQARANGLRTALISAQGFHISFFDQYFLGADRPDLVVTAPDYLQPVERVNELGVDDRLAIDAALAYVRQAPASPPYFMLLQLNATHWPCWTPTLGTGRWRDGGPSSRPDPARCEAATRFLDEEMVRLLAELEATGRLERTLVIVTSDHGEVFRDDRPMRRQSFLEDVLGIPFFVHLPEALLDRAPALQQNSIQRISNLDVFPTLLDAWGEWPLPESPVRPGLGGHSLLQPLPARLVIASNDSPIGKEPEGFAIYQEPFKWVVTETAGARLFNLEADPDERVDLSAQAPPAVLESLRRVLARRGDLREMARRLAPGLEEPAVQR